MERLRVAGITVDECGFTHLAYAQEIAGAMLRRQQAEAVVAARKTLVEGAVGMVEMALEMLSAKNVVELDDERRAAAGIEQVFIAQPLAKRMRALAMSVSRENTGVHHVEPAPGARGLPC